LKSNEGPQYEVSLKIQDSLVLSLRSIFKTIYENVTSVPFIDVALSLNLLDHWVSDNTMAEGFITDEQLEHNEKKLIKLMTKIQENVIVTNPKLYLGGAPNQLALRALMTQFDNYDQGSREFWEKCFVLLDNIMKASTG